MAFTSPSRSISIITNEFKRQYELFHKCPVCNKDIRFGVELGFLDNVQRYPYPHVILHGVPIHTLIVYIDADFRVRGIETAQSIEIQRNSETFS